MSLFRITVLLSSLAAVGVARPQVDRSLRAVRVATPPVLDGRLDERVWQEAPAATDFTSQWPDFGQPSPNRTDVRILYDDQYLYVGARLFHPDPKQGILARLHRRDQDSMSDWFTVYVDSQHDRRTAWAFSVNAGGVQRDELYYADSSHDASWDGVWESAVRIDAEGWSAELKIPLSLLRIHAQGGPQTWGINFARTDQGSPRGRSLWYLAPRDASGFVSLFPDLTGIEGVRPQQRREWIPYLSLQRKFETAQPVEDRTWKARVGLDVHLGINSSAQLDGTVRPDFGQVEVDQSVINLTTFETFFPEKRPFFLEGMELFQFPESRLFYSRRIGRGVEAPRLDPNERVLEQPLAAEIQAAGKYTHKFSSGFNLALLGANVGAARARVVDAGGRESDREVSPMTVFGVLRMQQSLDARGSNIGFMGTRVDQAGARGLEASVLATDLTWKSEDRRFTVVGTAAESRTGTPDNRRSGDRQFLEVTQRWNGGWWVDAWGVQASRWFNPNDLGYLRRADERTAAVGLGRTVDATWKVFRNWNWNLWASQSRDQAGQLIGRSVSGNFSLDTKWFWAFWINGGANLPAYDDRELRRFTAPAKKYLRTPTIPWTSFGFDTAGNRPWYARFNINREWYEGGPSTDVSMLHNIKLGRATELQLETGHTRDTGERKYVQDVDDAPVTGLRRMTQLNQTLRLAHAFSPTFTVQAFVQWLAGNWAYRDFKVSETHDRLRPVALVGDRVRSDRLWNINLITRWEFRPGSTAFLVYTHGAQTDALINPRGTLSPRRDLAILSQLPSDDVVQVKVSWLFR